ncbi:hypothetical protein [Mycobacterium rhizamassiliense]|uniref:hypothetical protein n=1 Tax=Mycobacterium rhizamassiliense TaxID=1841860 RepID=UPI00097D58B0|nr:hypothetical protein [Mycobacterium rhizamassiliense]
MGASSCAVCHAGFFGRTDAVYCSSACRQKAHRARTARRIAVLRERSRPVPATAQTQVEVSSSLRAAASSMRHSREQIDRAHALCQMSQERLQERAARQHEVAVTRGVPWPGN